MNPECLCFASGLMSSLAIKIVQSEEEPNVKSIELEIYMSAQKIEGVSVASAIRRLFTGSISSRLGDFIASMSKIQSLPLHPNSPQRLALCLKTLVNSSAASSSIFVLSSSFESLPQTLSMLSAAAQKSIRIEFVAIQPSSLSQPLDTTAIPSLASTSLSWKTDGGEKVPLDAKMVNFMAVVANSLNAKAEIVLSDDISRERLAMQLTQKILGMTVSPSSLRVILSHPNSSLFPPLHFVLTSQIKKVSQPIIASSSLSQSTIMDQDRLSLQSSASDRTVQIGHSRLTVPMSSLESFEGGLSTKSRGMDLMIQGLVSRSTVSESLCYGWPHLLLPDKDDLSSLYLDLDMREVDEGGSRNVRGVNALVQVAQEGQALILASSSWDTDLRANTLGRIWYLLTPASPPLPLSITPTNDWTSQQKVEGGEEANVMSDVEETRAMKPLDGSFTIMGCFMIQKIACREMLLPLQSTLTLDPSSQKSHQLQPTLEDLERVRGVLSANEVRAFDPLDLEDGSEALVRELVKVAIKRPPPAPPHAPHPPPHPPPAAMPSTAPATALLAVPTAAATAAAAPLVSTGLGDKGLGGARKSGGGKLPLEQVGQAKSKSKKLG